MIRRPIAARVAATAAVLTLAWSASPAPLAAQEQVMVPMRDGVKLATSIWKPPAPGRYPVVLTRGYGAGFGNHEKFVQAGYICVGQQTRGKGGSDGTRFFRDGQDGFDCLTWISQQPWCDGKIAMYGKSYWAATQWLAALEQHPNLKAIIPQNMNADIWQGVYWCNGALTLGMTASGRAYEGKGDAIAKGIGWKAFYRSLPLIDLDRIAAGGAKKLWRDYLSHSTFDDYWKPISIRADGADGKYRKIRIPVYLMGGWYDYYPGPAFVSFQHLKKVAATPEIRIVVNPADHLNRVVAARDFGPNASKDEVALAIRWLNYVLKGVDNGVKDEPPVQLFVMGINQWRFEKEWPLARTQFTKYYLRSLDGSRIGSLRPTPPGDEPPSQYTYDPNDPAPAIGGSHSFLGTDHPEILKVGAYDQTPNERRQDVLVFSSDPLEKDTEVTGPIVVKLYAASSAPDTDFIAKLIDVDPNGVACNLIEGIIRARFRESVWDVPKLLIPGRVYEYTIDLQATSNVFRKGHRIRVHLTSSNFPLWDRNPNTGHQQGMDTDLKIAKQTIYHDRNRASHILLPIIPPE